ncbi:MAG TPA: alpha-ketoglutarate-dependent dioxygenase AlkB [Candidatus Eisenbacteria bacterium]|nr:alpha-ketoglutarate-dependent dioxygenase AlkB [Candidatus Eisenbacteria bacterium]
MARAAVQTEAPEGLVYRPGFVDADEERGLLALLEELDFQEIRMRGAAARRTVLHFGYTYDYESRRLVPAGPLPRALLALRDRCAALAEIPPPGLAQALVTRYPAGATIGWHRDAPAFGPQVVGVSLLSDCRMLFRREAGLRRLYRQELARRSAYVLRGAARSSWQHSIPGTPGLRYSVTFRTLTGGRVLGAPPSFLQQWDRPRGTH